MTETKFKTSKKIVCRYSFEK